jgi:hypothetical protein
MRTNTEATSSFFAVHDARPIFGGRPRRGRSSAAVSGRRSTWMFSLFWSHRRPEQYGQRRRRTATMCRGSCTWSDIDVGCRRLGPWTAPTVRAHRTHTRSARMSRPCSSSRRSVTTALPRLRTMSQRSRRIRPLRSDACHVYRFLTAPIMAPRALPVMSVRSSARVAGTRYRPGSREHGGATTSRPAVLATAQD